MSCELGYVSFYLLVGITIAIIVSAVINTVIIFRIFYVLERVARNLKELRDQIAEANRGYEVCNRDVQSAIGDLMLLVTEALSKRGDI